MSCRCNTDPKAVYSVGSSLNLHVSHLEEGHVDGPHSKRGVVHLRHLRNADSGEPTHWMDLAGERHRLPELCFFEGCTTSFWRSTSG